MCNPKLAITVPDTVPILQEAFKQNNISLPIIVIDTFADRPDDTISYKEIVENTIDLDILKDVKTKNDDTAFLLYSSGTTGLPKGVELSHRNIVANCAQQNGDGSRLYQYTSGKCFYFRTPHNLENLVLSYYISHTAQFSRY